MIFSKLLVNGIVLSKNKPLKIYHFIVRNTHHDLKSLQDKLKSLKQNTINQTVTNTETVPIKHETPIKVANGFLMIFSTIGLFSLVYYGLGLSNETGIIENSAYWTKQVRDRVNSTFYYFGGTLSLTVLSAIIASKTNVLQKLILNGTKLSSTIFFGALLTSGMLATGISYDSNEINIKIIAWLCHGLLMGVLLSPLTMLSKALINRAIRYTIGIVGGLSLIAATAPSEQFLDLAAPLGIGLGVLLMFSLERLFFKQSTIGLTSHAISAYGGLFLFSLYLLYDLQKIVKKAETEIKYDPIKESIDIYLDVINIFIKILTILSTNEEKENDDETKVRNKEQKEK